MDRLEQELVDKYMPGSFPEDVNTLPRNHSKGKDEEAAKPPALKVEYVSPEWNYWMKGDSNLSRPDFPVDVIAVQGLASVYERTWTRTVEEDGVEKKVMWLKDLLPYDLPHARIMTFEYNSEWKDHPANVTLEDCAHQLLNVIRWDRRHKGKLGMCKTMSKRPLILVGYSYGGLVIKQAMVSAAQAKSQHPLYDDFQSILSSVTGIVYLGTPHAGSQFATWAIWQTRIAELRGKLTNPEILKPLEMNSDQKELKKLQAEFHKLRNDSRLIFLKLSYFWETEPVRYAGIEFAEVVDRSSACYGAMEIECQPLSAGHKYMNKFASRGESNYQNVKDCIKTVYDQSKSFVSRRLGNTRYGSQFSNENLVQLRRWLDPITDADSRKDTLRGLRFEGTCEWAMRLDVISRWLDPDLSLILPMTHYGGRCLWIYGKPGSGKSVLSVFLYDQVTSIVEQQHKDTMENISCPGFEASEDCSPAFQAKLWTAVYFPFHSSATLEQAVKKIVHRILLQHSANEALHKVASTFQSQPMTENIAINLLKALVGQLSLTYIVIDGLDECAKSTDGQTQSEMTKSIAKLLDDLCALTNVRLLLLSRRDLMLDHFMMKLLTSNNSMIDMAAHNSSDIELFIDIQISKLAKSRPSLAELQEYIVSTIASQSRGMFLWVKLVIEALEYEEGDKEVIKEALDHFPKGLNDAYKKTFVRLCGSPDYKKSHAVLALKWLACSRRALTTRELRTAILLHEKLPNSWKAEEIQKIVARVATFSEEELKDYFIRLLGPLAEFYRYNSIVNVVDDFGVYRGIPTVIRICHHSLRQLLFSSAEDETIHFDGFEFSERAAHFLAADTCMKMMCSPRAYETFLERFYKADDGDSHSIFLDYAVEHWSSHLRASGIILDGNNLNDLIHNVLEQSLNLSLLGVGALSEACARLSMAKVEQMMQAIAIRDCQALMLPAIDSIMKIRDMLPGLFRSLGTVHGHLENLGRLRRNSVEVGISNEGDAGTSKEIILNSELDSSYMEEIFPPADNNSNRERFSEIREELEAIRHTTRTLRSLAIKLSVDPMRAWLHQLIGDRGLNPIPVLALTTHALDIVLAAFLLPTTTNDRSNFRDQFSSQATHPLVGFIQSARNEVNQKGMKVLNAADYKKHVLPHYLLKKSQWFAVYLTTILLGTSTLGHGGLVHMIDEKWHPGSMMIAYEGHIYEEIQFSDAFDNEDGRYYRKGIAVTFAEMIGYISTIAVVYFARVLTIIQPHTGLIINQIIDQLQLKTGIFKPWIISLVEGWQHSSIALVLYLIRLYYCFWLFSYPRKAPWTDLRGILSDPFHYQSSIQQMGWTIFLLIIIQESFVLRLMTYDVFQSMMHTTMADGELRPQSRAGQRPLYRHVSWFKELGPSFIENFMAVSKKLLRHAREIGMALARMIFIERTYYEVSYIIFDILQITVQLLSPNSWTFGRLVFASYNIIGQAILAWCIQRMGVRGTIRFFWHLYRYWINTKLIWWAITNWSFTKFILVRPSIWIWSYIKMPFVWLFLLLRSGALGMAQYISQAGQFLGQVLWSVGPTILVIFTAILLVVFFTVFVVVMTDPLQLRSAVYSCKKARTVAAHATKNNHPLRTLQWRAGDLKRIESIPLVDLKQLNYLGAKPVVDSKKKATKPAPKTVFQLPKATAPAPKNRVPPSKPTPPPPEGPRPAARAKDPLQNSKLVQTWLKSENGERLKDTPTGKLIQERLLEYDRDPVKKEQALANYRARLSKTASPAQTGVTAATAAALVAPLPAMKVATEVTVTPVEVTDIIDVGSKNDDDAALGTGAESGDGSGTVRRRRADVPV